MKKLILLCTVLFVLVSCQEETKNKSETATTVTTDSAAIASVIHGFYQWYDPFVNDRKNDIDFIKVVGKHNTLDLPLFEKYLASIKASGFVSSEFLDKETAYYQACAKLWQKEEVGDIPSGMDANKYFCAQDWDLPFWTTSPIRISPNGDNRVKATLYGTHGDGSREQNFELKKEDNKWLLTKIECDMGIVE